MTVSLCPRLVTVTSDSSLLLSNEQNLKENLKKPDLKKYSLVTKLTLVTSLVTKLLEGKLVKGDECDECDDVSRYVTYSAKHKSYLGKRTMIVTLRRKIGPRPPLFRIKKRTAPPP